jgi:hypothetical protein
MITKFVAGQNKRRPDETASHYLSRLTHIYLQEKNIEEIVGFNFKINNSKFYNYLIKNYNIRI